MKTTPKAGQEPARLKLIQRVPKSAVCAEIGVWKGEFSKVILELALPRKLHLIDPWKFQREFPDRWYSGKQAKNQEDMDEILQAVISMFHGQENVKIHKGYSEAVLREFEDNYFDWVYIDGNHSYEYVLKDLELSYLKVKPGGLISGDDYTWGAKDDFPVRRAVQAFVEDNNLVDKLELLGSQFIIAL